MTRIVSAEFGKALETLVSYKEAQPKLFARLKEAIENVYGHEVHPRKIMRLMDDVEIAEKD